MSKIGLIVGYGLDVAGSIEMSENHIQDTPYGNTSSKISTGKVGENEVIILHRHGEKGDIPAFMVNYKANVFALNEMGCTNILATSICGSLQEEIMTGEFVVFDQRRGVCIIAYF